MYDGTDICRKIIEILPELGNCEVDLNVSFDDKLQVWRVSHDEAGRHALIFLEVEDVERCLSGRECLSLGLMARQLRERSCTF
jgi:hypothetical protein